MLADLTVSLRYSDASQTRYRARETREGHQTGYESRHYFSPDRPACKWNSCHCREPAQALVAVAFTLPLIGCNQFDQRLQVFCHPRVDPAISLYTRPYSRQIFGLYELLDVGVADVPTTAPRTVGISLWFFEAEAR